MSELRAPFLDPCRSHWHLVPRGPSEFEMARSDWDGGDSKSRTQSPRRAETEKDRRKKTELLTLSAVRGPDRPGDVKQILNTDSHGVGYDEEYKWCGHVYERPAEFVMVHQ